MGQLDTATAKLPQEKASGNCAADQDSAREKLAKLEKK